MMNAHDKNELVVLLFGALSRRAPRDWELAHYAVELSKGMYISDLMRTIAENFSDHLIEDGSVFPAPPSDAMPELASITPSVIPAAAIIRSAYIAFLFRDPAEGEINWYLAAHDSGRPLVDLVAEIAESAEAASIRRTRNVPIAHDDDLDHYLRQPFGNDLTLEALASALDRGLDAGRRTGRMTQRHEAGISLAIVLHALGFVGADPLQEKQALTDATAGIASEKSIEEIMHALYQVILGREPADQELKPWHNFYKTHNRLSALVAEIYNSPEATDRRRDNSCSQLETAESVADVLRVLYREILGRDISPPEIESWQSHYQHHRSLSSIILEIDKSEEATSRRLGLQVGASNGTMVQMTFEIIFNRGASAREVDYFRTKMETSGLTVNDLALSFFHDASRRRLLAAENQQSNDPSLTYLFGSHGVINSAEWDGDVDGSYDRKDQALLTDGSLLALSRADTPVVSIITSLYRGGRYIESFLKNITSQTIFDSHCELIIIDASSPEGEGKIIREYANKYSNIVYKRYSTRIGIYEAWNAGVKLARGRYITNANLDDCRREDSLEIQAAILDTLNFVDVAYQDVAYYFSENLSFEDVDRFKLYSNVPIISKYNLMEFNSPHNAPMWRKTLHDELGYFNEEYKSAADFDFWLRCNLAGKTFYKANEAHAGYYVNPDGLSTRPDTRGVDEANAISKRLYGQMVSPLLTMDQQDFAREIGVLVSDVSAEEERYDIVQNALIRLGASSRTGAAIGVGA